MKKEDGVTLVALVTTIIVLIILVSVSVNIAVNEGIIGNAKSAVDDYMDKSEESEAKLAQAQMAMGGSVKGENKVVLADTISGKKLNYKIYGNSVQNGTPTPENPVEIQSVGDKGKNLADQGNVIATSNVAYKGRTSEEFTLDNSYDRIAMVPCELEQGVTYIATLNQERIEGTQRLQIYFKDDAGNYRYPGIGNSFTLTFNATYMGIYVQKSTTDDPTLIDKIKVSNVMVNEGSTALPYEPYYEGYKIPVKINDTETNIYLDEPLRKIGEYVDYIDFEKQKVVRNVKVLDDTGTLTIQESYQRLDESINESIELPIIKTKDQVTRIEVLTNTSPSKIELSY